MRFQTKNSNFSFECTYLDIEKLLNSENIQETRQPTWKLYVFQFQFPPPDVAPGLKSPNGQVIATRCHWWGYVSRSDVKGGWKVGLQIWCPERGCPTMWPIPWCIWCYLPASIGQTDICENSTFHKLCLPAVIISVVILTDTSILLTSNRFALSVTHGCVVLSLPPETLSIL